MQGRRDEPLQNPAVDVVTAELHGLLRQHLRLAGFHRPCAVGPDDRGFHRSTAKIEGYEGGGASDIHAVAERGRDGLVECAEHDPDRLPPEARPHALPPATVLQASDDPQQLGPVRLVETARRGDGDVGDFFAESRLEDADDLPEEERSDILSGEGPPAHARHGPAALRAEMALEAAREARCLSVPVVGDGFLPDQDFLTA